MAWRALLVLVMVQGTHTPCCSAGEPLHDLADMAGDGAHRASSPSQVQQALTYASSNARLQLGVEREQARLQCLTAQKQTLDRRVRVLKCRAIGGKSRVVRTLQRNPQVANCRTVGIPRWPRHA